MHGAKHAGDELVDTIALLNQWYQRSDSAFIVRTASEVGKDEFLEGVDLILEGHQVGDGLVTFVGVIDRLQTDVLFIFESSCSMLGSHFESAAASRTVEFWMLPMEGKLGQEIVNVLGNEWRISSHALASGRAPRQALDPAGV